MTCPFKTLFERIGGNAAVIATVTKLYDKILSDEKLIPFFEHIDVEALRRSQYEFIRTSFGAPFSYGGKALRAAHAGLVKQGMSAIHFDAVMGHLDKTLHELDVPPNLIMEVMLIVDSSRDEVLGR